MCMWCGWHWKFQHSTYRHAADSECFANAFVWREPERRRSCAKQHSTFVYKQAASLVAADNTMLAWGIFDMMRDGPTAPFFVVLIRLLSQCLFTSERCDVTRWVCECYYRPAIRIRRVTGNSVIGAIYVDLWVEVSAVPFELNELLILECCAIKKFVICFCPIVVVDESENSQHRAPILMPIFFSLFFSANRMGSDAEDKKDNKVRRRTKSQTRAEEISTKRQKQRREQTDKP